MKALFIKYKPYLNLLLAIIFGVYAIYNWILVYEKSTGRLLMRSFVFSFFAIKSANDAYNGFKKAKNKIEEI